MIEFIVHPGDGIVWCSLVQFGQKLSIFCIKLQTDGYKESHVFTWAIYSAFNGRAFKILYKKNTSAVEVFFYECVLEN